MNYQYRSKNNSYGQGIISPFRVRTNIRIGAKNAFKLSDEYDDCWKLLNPICTKWCHDSGMTQAELSIDCSCYP